MLGGLGDNVHVASVVTHGQELGRIREVVVPQIVVDGLEVPQALACLRVERHQAVREQIVALAVPAVEVESRGTERNEHDAVLGVDGHLAPVVHTARRRQVLGRPAVGAEFSRPRNAVEGPLVFAGHHVEGANVSRRRSRRIVRAARERQNDGVLIDAPGIASRTADRAVRARRRVDEAVLAEGRDGLAGDRVDRGQIAARHIHEALVAAVLALPVVHALRRRALVRPALLPGGGVERHHGSRLHDEHRPPHHERAERERAATNRIAPRHLQLLDVRLVDLFQRRILRRIRSAAIRLPCVERALAGAEDRHRDEQHQEQEFAHEILWFNRVGSEYKLSAPL